jgi:hypothetical protein
MVSPPRPSGRRLHDGSRIHPRADNGLPPLGTLCAVDELRVVEHVETLEVSADRVLVHEIRDHNVGHESAWGQENIRSGLSGMRGAPASWQDEKAREDDRQDYEGRPGEHRDVSPADPQ